MQKREPAWAWAVIVGTGAFYVGALCVFLAMMWDVRRNIDVVGHRLPSAILAFERAIGYGGLIHNFKNHVLRPDEMTYGTAAIADHAAAIRALDEVEAVAAEAGLDIRTEDLRQTLDRYKDGIAAVDRMAAGGVTVPDIDELVRIADFPALQDLRSAHDEIAGAITLETAERQRQITIMAVVVSALMLLLPVTALTVLWMKRRAERMHVARIEALNTGLDRQNEKLEAANRALSATNAELNEFAHAAAHDLRTPLRGIAHEAEYLVEEFRDRMEQEVTERLIHIQALCKRLDSVMTILLRYARLAPPVHVDEVDPLGVIEEIEVGIAPQLAKSGGMITVETALPPVRCKRFDLGMVLQNLVENALTYNKAAQKEVAVGFLPQAEIGDEHLRDVFFVRDNGIGIDAEYHEDVFRMFRRLHHDDAFGPGAGAGLAYVKKVVENYCGVVRLRSEPGIGTSVYFSFTPQQAQRTEQDRKEQVDHVRFDAVGT